MESPINTKNDRMMIQEGLRQPLFIQPNFTKSQDEKLELKKVHNHYSSHSVKSIIKSDVGRFTVHIINPTKSNTFKTTYTTTICKSSIAHYLEHYHIEKDHIIKAYFKNKPFKL